MKEKFSILYCYPNYPSKETYGDVETIWLKHIKELRDSGFDVMPFCLSLKPPSYAIPFPLLDRLWKSGDKGLMKLYSNLELALEGRNVLLNATGLNLHPDFVSKLNVFTVFQFNDDPENSNLHSRHVASSYDLSLVGNIAEVETYKKWGVKNVEWMPIGLQPNLYDKSMSFDEVFSTNRDIEQFMMIDKLSKWRKDRLDILSKIYPKADFYGRGWEKGYIPANQEISYLLRTKISPNFHNSTGPINYRTFYAPANGALLICDNKNHLGQIFELGEEAVGFDSLEEYAQLVDFYLNNESERLKIAKKGYLRVMKDYTEVAVFNRTLKAIEYVIQKKSIQLQKSKASNPIVLKYSNENRTSFHYHKAKFYLFDLYKIIRSKLARLA